MKSKLLLLVAVVLFGKTQAQMFGTYNVPGTFSTIASAIQNLNGGVSGPVTINVAAGYTETAPVGGFSMGVIPGASSTNTITIRKNGGGANPLITAYVGTATPTSAIQDGVWRFIGTDWVTIDGIDIVDPNTTNPATMEFGYGFFKASATNGSQNNTIRNSVVSLSRANNAAGAGPAQEGSRGIDVVNALSNTHTIAVTVTSFAGTNSNNKFYSNTIQNTNIGISLIGFAAASPFILADTDNDIGGSTSSTGNNIINFGGGGTTSPSNGVVTLNQYVLNVSNNVINNNTGTGVNHNQILRGLFLNNASGAIYTIANNTITLKSAGTTQQVAAISNAAGTSGASTVTINDNLITNNSYTTATNGVFNAIINTGTPTDLNINNNTISNSIQSGTATAVLIETGSPVNASTNSNTIIATVRTGTAGALRVIKTTSPTNWTVSGNVIDGVNWTGASVGSISGIYSFNSVVNVTANNNIIRNMSIPGTGTLEGIREFGVSGTKIINNNQVYTFTTSAGGTGGSTFIGIGTSTGTITMIGNQVYSLSVSGATAATIAGIMVNGGTSSLLSKNKIHDLSTTSTLAAVNGFSISNGTTNLIYNNVIGNLRTTATSGSNPLIGINITGGTTNQVYYNTVYLNAVTTGTTFGSSALFVTSGTAFDLRNNILVNISTPAGTGITAAYRRSSSTLSTYSATSNNNLFYAGTPASNRLIYTDGTNNSQTLGAYKILVFNRDANSVTEMPPFASTTGSAANFLDINPLVPTQVESGAQPIAGITDDFASNVRNVSTPDIGAWEGNYTQSLCSGMPAPTSVIATQTLICPGVPFNLYSTGTYTQTGLTYQWLASTTSSTTGFSAVSGGTLALFTNTTLTDTTWYQLEVTCASAGSVFTSAPILVTAGLPTITAITNTNVICSSQSVNLSLSSNPAGASYQWITSTTGSNTGYAAIAGATLSTRTTTGAIGNNWFSSEVSCSADPSYSMMANPVSVTVNLSPTVTASGPPMPYCASSAMTLNATSNGTAFAWTGPNAYTSSSQNAVVPVPDNGNYQVVATIGNCSSSPAIVVVSTIGRTYGNNIVASPSASVCQSGTVNLSFAASQLGYHFSTTTGLPLLTLTSPTTLVSTSIDDTPAAAANIGFNFNFFGTNYTQFSASPDGWIRLGAGTGGAQFTNSVISTTNLPKIYPYWDDLATGTTGYVRAGLLGSTPTRTMVVEWFINIPRNLTGPANSTFQLLLLEGSNDIQFRYGTMGLPVTNSSGGLTVNSATYSSITFSTNTASTVTPNDQNFTAPASGRAYIYTSLNPTYSWSPSAGLSSTTATAVIATVTASTIYSLDLTVQGCVATKTIAINVNNPPVLIVTSSSNTICPRSTVSLTASGANTYSWNTGATSSVIVVTPSLTNLNTYTVRGFIGACSTTETVGVTRLAGPTLTLTGPSGICLPDAATLTVGGDALTYTWSTGSNSTSIVVTPTVPTQYTVTGTDADGCTNSLTRYVNVNTSLALNGTAPSTACAAQTITLTINGADTYTWSTNENTATITPAPLVTTTYSVIGAAGSCTGSAAITVSVIQYPTVSVAGNFTICNGETSTLTASGATTYSWNTGSTNSVLTVSPLANTVYTVTGYNGACGVSQPVPVVSNTLPVITIAQTAASVCFSTQTTFTASGASTYSWVNGPNTSTYVITPTVASVYTVSGTSSAGCASTRTVSLGVFALPNVVIAPASATVCENAPTIYTASGASTYTWNGTTSGSTISLASSSNTVYTVTGTSSQGCLRTETVGVTTLTLPVVTITAETPTICSQSPTTFTANGASTYMWSNNNSGSVAIAAPVTDATITVIGTSTNGCSSTASVALGVLPLPVIAITPSIATVCVMSTSNYTASGALTFTWSNTVQGPTVALTPSISSAYVVSGTDAQGCIGSQGLTILTNSLPAITVAPTLPTVCVNSPAIFTGQGANSYTWSTGPSGSTVVITPTTNTVYTVSGTNTITGCVGSNTFAVATRSAPILVIANPSASVCLNSSVTFSVSGAVTYSWNTGVFGPVLAVSPLNNTTYTISGKNAQNCESTRTVSVHVWALPTVVASSSTRTICAKEVASMSATGAVTYTWLPWNATGTNYTVIPLITTSYEVIGTDINNCTNSDTIKITVEKCTGIESLSDNLLHMNLYPNPSTGLFNVSFDLEGKKDITISNSTGAIVSRTTTFEKEETLDLSGVAKGIYFVTVKSGQTSGRYKIVIH